MRVLIIMGGFFPGRKYGGPPVSVDNFCSLLRNDAECFIVTHNHDMGDNHPYSNIQEGWNERTNVRVKYLSDSHYCKNAFRKAIIEVKPDYIYLQGLFQDCILPCLQLAKSSHIRVVLAPRGELCAGAFKKKYKKIPYIALLRLLGLLNNIEFQSTSEEESKAIVKYLGAKKDRIHLLSNIPSLPNGLPPKGEKRPGEGKFVFISRILWKKNLLKAITLLKRVKGTVLFDIYGPKEDISYWNECEKAIRGLPANVLVDYKGVISHEEIHTTFNQYDSFLFPTLSENYGHVIAESLASGCIPIISDQTPWNDMNEAGAGWALPLDDDNSFIKSIQEVVDMDDAAIIAKRKSIASYLDKKFQLEKLRNEYMAVFK